MKIHEILENQSPDILEWVKKYAGPDRYTHISGPQGVFSQKRPHYPGPVGVYAYDLNIALEKAGGDQSEFKSLIFQTATQTQHLNIIESKAKNTLDLGNYSTSRFSHDKKRILDFFSDKCKQNLEDKYKSAYSQEWLKTQQTMPWDDPGNVVDFVTTLAFMGRKTCNIKNPQAVVSYVFWKILGYDSIKDAKGKSQIAVESYEPDQMVFLTRSAFVVVATHPQPIRKDH